MATRPRTRSFFYLVKANPPTRDEFRPYFEEGKVPPNASPHEIDVLKGVSMWVYASADELLRWVVRIIPPQ